MLISSRLLAGSVALLWAAIACADAGAREDEFSADWVTDDAKIWEQHVAHLKDVPEARGLEIGSFEGRSAIWFLENILTGDSARLTCVDTFPTEEMEGR